MTIGGFKVATLLDPRGCEGVPGMLHCMCAHTGLVFLTEVVNEAVKIQFAGMPSPVGNSVVSL